LVVPVECHDKAVAKLGPDAQKLMDGIIGSIQPKKLGTQEVFVITGHDSYGDSRVVGCIDMYELGDDGTPGSGYGEAAYNKWQEYDDAFRLYHKLLPKDNIVYEEEYG